MSDAISTQTVRHLCELPEWGVAREGGERWDSDLFAVGVEITEDRMVLVALGKRDAINAFMYGNEGVQPGRLFVVNYTRRGEWHRYPEALVHQEIKLLAYGHSNYRQWIETHPEARP